jgi:hypothetical protein
MASFRYNINDQRWEDGSCYSVIDYSVSYDPIKNETTVTFGRTLTRVWGAEGTTSYETTTLTVRADDGGATASTTASASDYFWNYGFIVLQPTPSPVSVTVKHSDVAGAKSVTISASTVLNYNGNESSSASGSVTVATGERKGYYAIDDGSKILQCIPYIDDGTQWLECIPYVDNGSNWVSGN